MEKSDAPTLIDKARAAARNQKPLVIKSYKLPSSTEAQIEEVLGIFLAELGREQLKDSLAYCLRELTVNGKKANTKRVYFREKELDLQNAEQYRQGMTQFKSETLDNIDYWLQKQEEAGLYVKVSFHIRGRTLEIKIANNTKITRKEQIRIYDRIARSRAFRSLEEAMTSVLDDSEGAGLGIVILVLMLKKMGLDEEAFDIDVEGEETVARLIIPMDKAAVENLNIISTELSEHIERLPEFPESIIELQRMIEDPDAEMTEIARTLGKDPSLTADLIRTVNSARYMLPRRMDNVVEAVKVVGLRGLRQMLFSYGTQRVLNNGVQNDTTRRLWEHSQRTAFYAYGIARYVAKRKDILDDVYVGGILHDMGKIVFANLHPKTAERVRQISLAKGISTTVFEAMSDGVDHAEVGARLAKRWNFPETLVETIRHHHTPLNAQAQYRDVVAAVYVANELANLTRDEYDHIDIRALRIIGISRREQVRTVHERLRDQYDREFVDLSSRR
jgi:putative nucleotidyltransferase with HDIG domain